MPKKSKHQSKSDRTKNKLADALQQLSHEMPLNKVSVKAIAQRAGVDRQTFYYHFDTIDDLVEYLCHRQLEALSLDLHAVGSVAGYFDAIVAQVEANRQLLRTFVTALGRNTLKEFFHDDAINFLRTAADKLIQESEAGTKRATATSHISEKQRNFAVEYCVLGSASMLQAWLFDEVQASEKEMAQALTASFEQQICGLWLTAHEA